MCFEMFVISTSDIRYKTQAVAKAIEEKDFQRAIAMRDPEFAEMVQNFSMTSTLTSNAFSKAKVWLERDRAVRCPC